MFYACSADKSYEGSYLIDSGGLSRRGRGEPGGSSLSFASPKESNQRKGDPVRRPFASLRVHCGARSKRGLAQTRFAQTSASPDPLCPVLLTDSPRVGEEIRVRGKSESKFESNSPPRPAPFSRNRAAAQTAGRLFFCLLCFWRSKRKVSCRRATPGNARKANLSQRQHRPSKARTKKQTITP